MGVGETLSVAIAFSNTTAKNGVIQRCEIACGLGDTGISGNATLLLQFTAIINSWYQKVVTMILASQTDWDWDDIGTTDGTTPTQSTYPIAKFSLVTGQRDYPLGAVVKFLKLKRVDVTYDGINWYPAMPFDSGVYPYGLGNEANTDAQHFSDITKPHFDVRANSLFIYPAPSATQVAAGAAARIDFSREPSEFVSTDTTKTLGIDTPFQPMIALGASYEWTSINAPGIALVLKPMVDDYEARLKEYYPMKDLDQVMYLAPLKNNFR